MTLFINFLICSIPRFKQKFAFVTPPLDNDLAILDTLKVCDTVLFIISAAAGFDFGSDVIDDWGNNILLSAFAQVPIEQLIIEYLTIYRQILGLTDSCSNSNRVGGCPNKETQRTETKHTKFSFAVVARRKTSSFK